MSWFAAAAKNFTLSPDRVVSSLVQVEAQENYQKQSYRNRCRIAAAEGVESLSVPVVHEGGTFRLPVREIKLDYTEPWVIKTERAITSAYESSPFFEYYKDGIFEILDSRLERLWDLNMSLIRLMTKALGLAVEYVPTTEYLTEAEEDFRAAIHPKRPDDTLRQLGLEKPYYQVFSRKYGFQPNLSALDLLFNEGPDSILYLKKL